MQGLYPQQYVCVLFSISGRKATKSGTPDGVHVRSTCNVMGKDGESLNRGA